MPDVQPVNEERPERVDDGVGSHVETDAHEIAAMAQAGLVIRESEAEVLGRSFLELVAQLSAREEELRRVRGLLQRLYDDFGGERLRTMRLGVEIKAALHPDTEVEAEQAEEEAGG